jgi:hypothetical protein
MSPISKGESKITHVLLQFAVDVLGQGVGHVVFSTHRDDGQLSSSNLRAHTSTRRTRPTPRLDEILLAALESVFTCASISEPKSPNKLSMPTPMVAAFAMP